MMRLNPNRMLLAAAAIAASALGGCVSSREAIGDGPQYPPVRQSRVIDVQVLRDETKISMTNTTAANLPAGLLWINGWFSRKFDGLAIGQTVTFGLDEFEDRYGDAFRAGGFFATELPDRVVLAQLQPIAEAQNNAEPTGMKQELIGLVVIRPVE